MALESIFGEVANAVAGLAFTDSVALRVFYLIILLAVVSFFIYGFYKSTGKRNLLSLNLKKYNYSNHPVANKFFATLFYLIEYIVIIPILLVLWFAGLSIVLLLLAQNKPVEQILFASAAVIGAIRVIAYFKGELAKDLAKLFPFIALSVFLLSPEALNISRISEQIREIPLLLNNIAIFIFVVFLIEFALRVFYTFYQFLVSEDERGEDSLSF